MKRLLLIATIFAISLASQVSYAQSGQALTKPEEGNKRATRVSIIGDSIVQATPDTAIVVISVVTQAKQAVEAQKQNALKSDRTITALKAAAGSGAEVKTNGYS